MTDREMLELRELLELAAKAAGIEHHGYCSDGYLLTGDGESGAYTRWNPRHDDGDAFRLAVKLRIAVTHPEGDDLVRVWYGDMWTGPIYEYLGDDPCAATRLAILRAAAEIGKAMP